MEQIASASRTNRASQTIALTIFAIFSLWINWEVKMNVQGRSQASVVNALGNAKVGQPAPNFSAFDLSNNAVSLESYRGRKVVLLDFWATWCGPCRAAMIALQSIEAKLPTNALEILSINQGETAGAVSRLIARNNYDFHVLLDSKGEVSALYGLEAIPTLILIDKSGVVQRIQVGYSRDESDLRDAISKLLKR